MRGVSFDLAPGQVLGIVGESGPANRTALSIIQLLDPPGRVARAKIRFEGVDLTRIGNREMAAIRGREDRR